MRFILVFVKHSKKIIGTFIITYQMLREASGRLVNSNANDFFNQILSFDSVLGRRQLAKECFSYFTFHVFLRPVASLWTVDKFEIHLIVASFTLQCRWSQLFWVFR